MNRNHAALTLVVLIALAGIAGFLYSTKTVPPAATVTPPQQIAATPPSLVYTQPASTLEYQNVEYGFSFSLPSRWQGYSIVTESWEGQPLDTPETSAIRGPKILIRHPLWTAEKPRQDIPIMIFTPAQWDLVQQEKLSLGAAPIPPSELGRNAQYVFALPARYNYAFPEGFEEVERIIQGLPLRVQ